MTRRSAVELLGSAVACGATGGAAGSLKMPVHRMVDSRAGCTAEQLHHFWWTMWPECVQLFNRCGLELDTTDAPGEIKRSPASKPIFTGVRRRALNIVVTRQIPLGWARGRGIAGVTTIWEGHHVCLIALDHAHANRIPLLAVNTLLHEMLHAILQDVFVVRPTPTEIEKHELRVNWIATRLWLFGDATGIRDSAEAYRRRLASG